MKNPDRATVSRLVDLPNIGKAVANDLYLIGIDHPGKLIVKDPFNLYKELCCAQYRAKCMIHVLLMCLYQQFISWKVEIRFLGGHLPENEKGI